MMTMPAHSHCIQSQEENWAISLQKAFSSPDDITIASTAWKKYRHEVCQRRPQPGDLTNMDLLCSTIAPFHQGLHKEIHDELTSWSHQIALRYYSRIFDNTLPISYSGSLEYFDDMLAALDAIVVYEKYTTEARKYFDMHPLAERLQSVAKAEKEGFSDYKDDEFAQKFNDLTLKVARRHLYNKNSGALLKISVSDC